MSGRARVVAVAVGGLAAALAFGLTRHARRAMGRSAPGGILIADAASYDALSVLLRSLFAGIARDVASSVPSGGRILEVGCGPGRLSHVLAGQHGLDVTGVDLDPAMIDRARARAARSREAGGRTASFVVGDVASLAFPDASFDLVVSTLSMHHWDDPAAGLVEIARVLRPSGRALIWDLRAGPVPLHGHMPDPAERATGTSLRVARSDPWRWPWRLVLLRRLELVGDDPSATPSHP